MFIQREQIFDNSLEKGKPNDIRITGLGPGGDTNVIPGLDEGILTMRSGGIRRLYIPGELAFPKGEFILINCKGNCNDAVSI